MYIFFFLFLKRDSYESEKRLISRILLDSFSTAKQKLKEKKDIVNIFKPLSLNFFLDKLNVEMYTIVSRELVLMPHKLQTM